MSRQMRQFEKANQDTIGIKHPGALSVQRIKQTLNTGFSIICLFIEVRMKKSATCRWLLW
jgi:hypothetical protein